MSHAISGLSSSQRGTIAEYFVATALMAASGGRLSPFVPLVDDHGVDLIVLDKETGRSVSVQVKSWIGRPSARRTVQFDVRRATFRQADGGVLLALVLEPTALAMEVAWLIPMSALPAVAIAQPEKYAVTPSTSPQSRDRYASYRHSDAASLASGLLEMISGASNRVP